jgi:hypothetical protein
MADNDPTRRKAWNAVVNGDVTGLEMLLMSPEVRIFFCCPPSEAKVTTLCIMESVTH